MLSISLLLLSHCRIDDSFADAWSSYGGALAKMGRCEEAVSALQKVLLLSSTSADVYSNTATYFQLCGESLSVGRQLLVHGMNI